MDKADSTIDPRHDRRVKLVQLLYAATYKEAEIPQSEEDVLLMYQKIAEKEDEIDSLIEKHAPKYPIDQIAKTDRAILHLAIYELLYEKDTPTKVVINEAVELAHELGSDRSYAFVNAVLGAFIEEL